MYESKSLTRGSGLYYFGQEGGARGHFVGRKMPRTLTRIMQRPTSRFAKQGGCPMVLEVAPMPMPEQQKPVQRRPAKKKAAGLNYYGQGIANFGAGVNYFGGNFSNSAASPGDLNSAQLQQLREMKQADPYGEAPVFDRHSLNLLSNVIQSKQILETEQKKKPAPIKGSGMRFYK
jgi:hypothetical protein